jgi:hypothetical protein
MPDADPPGDDPPRVGTGAWRALAATGLQAHRDTLRHGQASLQRQVERLTEAYLAGVMGGGGQGSIGYADGMPP